VHAFMLDPFLHVLVTPTLFSSLLSDCSDWSYLVWLHAELRW
jgi:hypothetical protein